MNRVVAVLALLASSVALAEPLPLRCTANAGVPPVLRGEGRAERLGDLVVTCMGGTVGTTLTGTLKLSLNTRISSRRVGSKTEALLLVDEPGLPRGNGQPTVPPTYGVNVFQGIIGASNNEITFPNLVLPAPDPDMLLVLRITNVRADASALGISATMIPAQIVSFVSFLPNNTLWIDNPQQTLGYSQRGLSASIRGAGPADSGRTSLPICISNNLALLSPGAQNGSVDMVLRFTEGHQYAFKPRSLTEQRNTPGIVYADESGFVDTSFPSADGANQAGLATTGTRLMAAFSNVPSGVALYVTTAPVAIKTQSAVRMVNGGTGTLTPVPLVNGAGVVAWEVEQSVSWDIETIDFGLLVGYRANTIAPGAINVQLSLAPTAESEYPNFLASMGKSTSIPFYTCGVGQPDLTVDPLDNITKVVAGVSLRPRVVIRNSEVAAAGAFDYTVELLRQDQMISSVRGRATTGIAANQAMEARPVVPVPATLGSGDYRVRIRVDVGGEVAEVREDNNERIEQITVECGVRLIQSAMVVPSDGGAFPVPVESGCLYVMYSSDHWIRVVGNNVTVESNTTGWARQGSIRIGSTELPVVQAYSNQSCTFMLSAPATEFPETGGTRSFTIWPSAANCQWRAVSNSWMQMYPSSGTGSAQVQLTVFPNLASTPRAGRLMVGNTAHELTQRGSTGSEDRRLVQQVYFNFFGRLPSEPEIALQEGELSRGVSRAELIDRFMNTPEFNLGGRFIAGLYVGLLGRDAEYGGWLFQRNALSTSVVTQTQLVKNFLETREWELTFGTPTDAEFVKLLYRNVLLREGTPPEIAFHEATLRSGVLTRVALATNFLNTAEFRIGTGSRLTAFLLYATLLYRDASTSEFDSMRFSLNAGATVRSRLELMTESYEFRRLLE